MQTFFETQCIFAIHRSANEVTKVILSIREHCQDAETVSVQTQTNTAKYQRATYFVADETSPSFVKWSLLLVQVWQTITTDVKSSTTKQV